MKANENIEQRLQNLAQSLGPDDDLIQKVMTRIETEQITKTPPAPKKPGTWSIILKSKIIKLAAAAVIIIAVLTTVHFLGGPIDGATIAFAEIEQAVNQMPVVHRVGHCRREGREYRTENWYFFDSRIILYRFEVDGKCYKISSMNYQSMENIVYDPDSDVVTIKYRVDVDPMALAESPWVMIAYDLERYYWYADIQHKRGSYQGVEAEIYSLVIPRSGGRREEAEFIVTKDTHLPIMSRRRYWTAKGEFERESLASYDFPAHGPNDVYDIGAPQTAKVIYDTESWERLQRKEELLKERAACQKRFSEDDHYRLNEDEVLKHIPPAYIEPRTKLEEINSLIRQLNREGSLLLKDIPSRQDQPRQEGQRYKMFYWDGEMIVEGSRPTFRNGVSLETALKRIICLSEFEYDAVPNTLADIEIPGDWVVRQGAPKEELLEALAKVFQDVTARRVRFVKRIVERDVIVARGRFSFVPLSGTYDDTWVHVYSDKLDPDERGGGGSGSLDSFLTQRLGDVQLNQQVVDLTESSSDIWIQYGCHESGYIRNITDEAERSAKLDMLLDNLSRQTSLVFTRERREVPVWRIVDDSQY